MIDPGTLTAFGEGLHRPESVLITGEGDVHVSDSRGGVVSLMADGTCLERLRSGLIANGIARMGNGDFVAANMGVEGGVWRHDGRDWQPFIMTHEGEPLGLVNFVLCDAKDRLWITLSDRKAARGHYSAHDRSGRILLWDDNGLRTVAEGLCWTNECRLSADGLRLYVNETFARRTTVFAVCPDGSLSDPRIAATYGHGTFPDGLWLEDDGSFWIVSVISNRLVQVDPQGHQTLWLSDPPSDLEEVEQLYQAGQLTRTRLSACRWRYLNNLSSIAFLKNGQKKTALLGSLGGQSLYRFDVREEVSNLPGSG